MKKPAIRLHIEELVLHGFAPNDRHVIAAAVERELSRRLAGEPESAIIQHSNHGRIDVGAFHVEQGSKPNSIGNQIAEAIHGGLTK